MSPELILKGVGPYKQQSSWPLCLMRFHLKFQQTKQKSRIHTVALYSNNKDALKRKTEYEYFGTQLSSKFIMPLEGCQGINCSRGCYHAHYCPYPNHSLYIALVNLNSTFHSVAKDAFCLMIIPQHQCSEFSLEINIQILHGYRSQGLA